MYNVPVTTLSPPRPSSTAARLALAFGLLALLGLLAFPLATFGRNFDGSGVLLTLYGGVLDLAQAQLRASPATGPTLVLAWLTLAACLLSVVAALTRARWLWLAGLATFVLAVAAIVVFKLSVADVSQHLPAGLRAGQRRFLTRFFVQAGADIGLVLPLLSGLVATFAGLSMFRSWWDRLNRLRALLVPLVAIGLAVVVGAVVVLIIQPVPAPAGGASFAAGWLGKADLVWFVYASLFAPLTNLPDLFQSLTLATPLIFTGLGVAMAYRVGLFNIGVPGQLTAGAIGATLVGLYLKAPAVILMPAAVVGAALAGAFWGAIPGFLKARFGSSEVINTIMLNYIASAILLFMIGNDTFQWFGTTHHIPFKLPGSNPESYPLQPGARFASLADLLGVGEIGAGRLTLGPVIALAVFVALYFTLRRRGRTLIALGAALVALIATWAVRVPLQVNGNLAGSTLNVAFLLALAAVAFFAVYLWRTAGGYALRAVGLSPKAAEYGGINVARGTVLAMTLAGLFGGLAGTHYTMGGVLGGYALKQSLPASVGFDGITVALMGQSTPVGVVAASVLFGTLDTGGVNVSTKLSNVNRDIVTVLKSLIVLFIAAGGFLLRRVTDPPPPQLVRAVDEGKHAEDVRLATPGPADRTPEPLPNTTPGSVQSGEGEER